MAEEGTGAAPAGASTASETHVSSRGIEGGSKYSNEEVEALRRKAEFYDNINKKYTSDPQFKDKFDKGWYGQDEEEAQPAQRLDPAAQYEKKIQVLERKMEELAGIYGTDKVTEHYGRVSNQYAEEFTTMAEAAGYDAGTAAFNSLFRNAKTIGYEIAKKYGLTDRNGQPLPALKFNKEFIKEAFDIAYKEHKEAGFDTAWRNKKETMRVEEEKKREQNDELAPYFDPKKLRTRKDRADALEKAFRHKYRGQELKIV